MAARYDVDPVTLRRFTALTVGLLAVVAACSGGGDGSSLPDGQYDVGGDVAVAVHTVRDPVTGTGFDGHVVAVDVEWVNRGHEPVTMTLAYGVELHDDDGREAETVTLPDTMPRRPKTLPAGSSVRGWIGFELADGGAPAELLLYGEIGDDPVVVDL